MKLKLTASLCLLTAFAVSGASPDGMSYQEVKIGADTYTISCDWLEQNILLLELDHLQQPTDFFVKDDIVYYNRRNSNSGKLQFYDPAAPKRDHLIDVDCTGLDVMHNAFYFVGTDSEGTPFFSSFASHKWSATDPFTIVPIEIKNGKAKATKVINLNLIDDWFTDEVWISGSLNDDKFRVIARIKKGADVNSLSTWGYAEWYYDGSEKSKNPIACASEKYSAGVGIPVGEDRVIFYDASMPYDASDDTEYNYTTPTMCSIDDSGISKKISSFDGNIENKHGSGLDIVEFDGKHFMLYGSGFAPAKYGVAYLPDYPNSLASSVHLWTLGSESMPYSSQEESFAPYYKHNAKPMAIHADKDVKDGLSFYTLTNMRGIAKYTIRKKVGINVGIDEIKVDTVAEYYSLEGIKLAGKPTDKGVYICRKGDTTTKIIVK